MPRKLRAAKYRYDAEAELKRFAMVFICGADYFSETGLPEACHVWPPEKRPAARRAWRAGVKDAWQRLGARFLERWVPKGPPPHPQTPWALDEFGPP